MPAVPLPMDLLFLYHARSTSRIATTGGAVPACLNTDSRGQQHVGQQPPVRTSATRVMTTNQAYPRHVDFDATPKDYTRFKSRKRANCDRISRRSSPGRHASPDGHEKVDHSFWDRGPDVEVGPDVYDNGPHLSDNIIAQVRARERVMWLADVVYNGAFEIVLH
ncbi:hypothetical protein DOTSEDRAFT_72041, partial [Dothistroma septosporum NZE10]